MNVAQLLDRILDPVANAFSPEVARRIVALKASEDVQSRVDDLAAKANDGDLTEDQRAEYEAYVDAIDLVSILQAKSRRMLNDDR